MEETLRASEERFQAAFDESALGALILDRAGRVCRSNAAAAELLGWPLGGLDGQHYLDLVHPAQRGDAASTLQLLFEASGFASRRERRFLRRDGKLLVSRLHGTALHDAEGNTSHALIQIEDVTERERAQQALRASEERLQLALVAARGGILDWDVTTGELFVSPELASWYEGAPTLRGAERLLAPVHEHDRELVQGQLDALLTGEADVVEVEHRVETRAGALRWHYARAVAVSRTADGVAARVTALVLDVTETKRLQARRVFSARLAALEQLAAGISQELSGPLDRVLHACDQLLEATRAARPEGAPALESRAGEVRAELGELAEALRDLRGLERADGALEPLDVRDAVRAATRLARHHLPATARLEVRLEPVPPVRADRGLLTQVLVQLLANAAEALPATADAAQRVGVTVGRREDHVVVEVVDSGRGIRPDDLPRVLDPLFTTKRGRAGGVGLSFAHTAVAQLGGSLDVRSGAGAGARVTIALPVAVEDERALRGGAPG